MKKLGIFLLAIMFNVVTTNLVSAALTQVGNVQVTAEVLGVKPQVYNFSATTGLNTGATVITAIVGRNFTGAYVVSLDDANSTVLTGTLAVVNNTDNVATDPTAGGGGIYQKITGLSVPSGIAAGIYNILVTSTAGTNIVSDVKFTVTAPPPVGVPAILAVTPNPLVLEISQSQVFSLNVEDSNSATVYYSLDSNGGTWDASTGSIAMSSQLGTAALTFTAGAAAGAYANVFKINDDIGQLPGVSDHSVSVDFYIQPVW